jgi:hypothetical protein
MDYEVKAEQLNFASACILGMTTIVRNTARMKDRPSKIEETASHGLQ